MPKKYMFRVVPTTDELDDDFAYYLLKKFSEAEVHVASTSMTGEDAVFVVANSTSAGTIIFALQTECQHVFLVHKPEKSEWIFQRKCIIPRSATIVNACTIKNSLDWNQNWRMSPLVEPTTDVHASVFLLLSKMNMIQPKTEAMKY